MENWAYNPGEKVNLERENKVPVQFCSLIRQVIRDMCLDKKRIPTLLIQFTKEFDNLRDMILQIKTYLKVLMNIEKESLCADGLDLHCTTL